MILPLNIVKEKYLEFLPMQLMQILHSSAVALFVTPMELCHAVQKNKIKTSLSILPPAKTDEAPIRFGAPLLRL